MGGGVVAVTVIAAYDISSDHRRGRLAAEFQGWGYRLQESVFQLRIEPADLEVLRGRIRDIMAGIKQNGILGWLLRGSWLTSSEYLV